MFELFVGGVLALAGPVLGISALGLSISVGWSGANRKGTEYSRAWLVVIDAAQAAEEGLLVAEGVLVVAMVPNVTFSFLR